MTNGIETTPADWDDRLDTPKEAHSHRPVRDVLRDLNISGLERAFLWLSKTDVYVLALCPYSTRLTLSALGMMVLFTTLLAFGSGFYTIKTTVISPENPLGWPIGLILAGVYAFGILIIDREIVGATTAKALWIRFLFAFLIATAVSYPVKLKFFEGRVNNEIVEMNAERNAESDARIRQLRATGETERSDQRALIMARMASLDREIEVLDREISREQQVVECGPKCQGFRAQKEELMLQRIAAEEALGALSAPASLSPEIEQEIAKIQASIDEVEKNDFDFLTKWEAIGRIKTEVDGYYVISVFIFAFFALLELVPVGLKLSLGKTEYHYYIQARNEVNNTKIVSIANVFMEMMEKNPKTALTAVPLEISDLIARALEDESVLETEFPDPRSIGDIFATATGRNEPVPNLSGSEQEATADPRATRKEDG